MFKRKRAFNGVWFPTKQAMVDVNLNVASGAVGISAQEVVRANLDDPASSAFFTNPTLGDFLRQGYLLKRVVGHVFVRCSGSDSSVGVDCYAGLFVQRVDIAGDALEQAGYNPFGETSTNSSQKRWLWRRTWKLCPFQGIGGATTTTSRFPSVNTAYGSVREGAFLDCKSQARVGLNEKLFIMFAAQNTTAAAQDISFTPHLRVFGKPLSLGQR